jgi:hypothetical protein
MASPLLVGSALLLVRTLLVLRLGMLCWGRARLGCRPSLWSRTLCGSAVLLGRRALLGGRAGCGGTALLRRRSHPLLRSGGRALLRYSALFRHCALLGRCPLLGHRALLRSGGCAALRHGVLLRSGCSPLLLHIALGHVVLLDREGTALLGNSMLLGCRGATLFHCRSTVLLGCGSAALFHCRGAALLRGVGVLGLGGADLVGVLLVANDRGGRCGDGVSAADRLSARKIGRSAVVGGVELLLVASGILSYLTLFRKWRCVVFVKRGHLGWTRTHGESALSAVVADAVLDAAVVVDVVVDDGVVIGIAAATDVGDGAIVVEVVTLPVATEVAYADVAIAVVHTTVIADMGTPVAAVEAVTAVVIAPVGRRPESAVVGGRAPGAGDPVIAAVTPAPVAGRPDVIGIGSGRLVVLGERRGSLVGVIDCIFASVLITLILIVVALDDGGGSLLLVALALLPRGVGRVGAEDLRSTGGGSEVGIGRISVGAGRGDSVVDGGGVCGIIGTALATCEANGEQGCCAKKAEGASERRFGHSRSNSRAARKLRGPAAYDVEMPEVARRLYFGRNWLERRGLTTPKVRL